MVTITEELVSDYVAYQSFLEGIGWLILLSYLIMNWIDAVALAREKNPPPPTSEETAFQVEELERKLKQETAEKQKALNDKVKAQKEAKELEKWNLQLRKGLTAKEHELIRSTAYLRTSQNENEQLAAKQITSPSPDFEAKLKKNYELLLRKDRENAELHGELQDTQSQIKELNIRLNTANQRIEDLDNKPSPAKMLQIEAKPTEKDEIISQKDREIGILCMELQTVKSQFKILEKRFTSAKQDDRKAKQGKHSLYTRRARIAQKSSTSPEPVIAAKVPEAFTSKPTFSAFNAETEAALVAAKKELATVKEGDAKTKVELANAQKVLSDCREALVKSQEAHGQSEQELANHKVVVDQNKKDLEQGKKDLAEALEAKAGNSSHLEIALAQKDIDLEQKEKALVEKLREVEYLSSELKSKNEAFASLDKALNEKNQEVDYLSFELNSKKEVVASHEQMIQDLQNRQGPEIPQGMQLLPEHVVEKANNDYNNMKAQFTNLEQAYDVQKNTIASLQTQCRDAFSAGENSENNNTSRYYKLNQDLNDQLHKSNISAQNLDIDNQNLRREIEDLTTQLEERRRPIEKKPVGDLSIWTNLGSSVSSSPVTPTSTYDQNALNAAESEIKELKKQRKAAKQEIKVLKKQVEHYSLEVAMMTQIDEDIEKNGGSHELNLAKAHEAMYKTRDEATQKEIEEVKEDLKGVHLQLEMKEQHIKELYREKKAMEEQVDNMTFEKQMLEGLQATPEANELQQARLEKEMYKTRDDATQKEIEKIKGYLKTLGEKVTEKEDKINELIFAMADFEQHKMVCQQYQQDQWYTGNKPRY
ncbi:hypothetical protein BT63DRAFT_132672 [Microthyrium microscopicum]|uniref:Uncharacterized protein n=1 Tax=Microthyrium microscopicum TaxID=703497 RepID=A0A6A6UNI4_9PEZI|nr:hypothetical protein BT63DRAFT_132672 [Microthyrium microscopicum]